MRQFDAVEDPSMTDMEITAVVRACKVALKSLFETSKDGRASINDAEFEALIAGLLRVALRNGLTQPS